MPDRFRLDSRRIVVTGGATGVGAALLDQLADLGATAVTVLDVVEPTGPHDQFLRVDLSAPDQIDDAIAQIDGPLHALFNNAGIADTQPPERVFAVNYLALRKLTDALADQLADGGAVVNTASIAGSGWAEHLTILLELMDLASWDDAARWFARSAPDGAVYGFTKECVQIFTMHAAPRLSRRGIRINSVCPAPVDTKLLTDFRATMTDALIDWAVAQGDGQLVTPEQVASVLAFLATPASAAMTGANVLVDRGFTAAMATGQADFSTLEL